MVKAVSRFDEWGNKHLLYSAGHLEAFAFLSLSLNLIAQKKLLANIDTFG